MRLLAGDIGGTKTILRLFEVTTPQSYQTLYQAQYASQEYSDLVPIVQEFLAAADDSVPEAACFAIAGPVINNTSQLTNLSWYLDNERLENELGIAKVRLINDFAAVCYGILGLNHSDIYTLQPGKTSKLAPIAVIGAGTGLGEGFLVPQGDNYQIFATEGGHADFAPRSALELDLLHYLLDKYQIDRVSVERVVSGQGIAALYQFLRDRNIAPESPDIAEEIRSWEQQVKRGQEKTLDPAAVISRAAIEQRDRLCEKTMEMFVEAYGAEAGNLALKLLPFGGLYIAGGIAAKNLQLIEKGRFLTVFRQKGRLSPLLEQVPVHIILNPQVGLLGSILYVLK